MAFECAAAFLRQVSSGIPSKRRSARAADGSYEPGHDLLELQGSSYETGCRTVLAHRACPGCNQRNSHKGEGRTVFQLNLQADFASRSCSRGTSEKGTKRKIQNPLQRGKKPGQGEDRNK